MKKKSGMVTKSTYFINTKHLKYCRLCNTFLIKVSNEDEADEKHFKVSIIMSAQNLNLKLRP